MSTVQRISLLTALTIYAGLVFVIDVITPDGIEIWVLNLPVIIVPVIFRNLRMVMFLSAYCSVMLALGWVIESDPGNDPPLWNTLNRGMGLATLWLIAVLAIILIKRSTQLDNALRALEHSEERLRLAMEGAGMGTFDVNLLTGDAAWSATHLRLLGFDSSANHQNPIDLWRTGVHPDDVPYVLAAKEHAIQCRAKYSVEFRIQRADNGEITWLAVFGRFYYSSSGEAIRFVGVSFDITRRRQEERESLQREVLAMMAREQRRIGQELHDGIGQQLTGLGLMAKSLSQRVPEAGTEKHIAIRLLAEIDNLHQRIRELAATG